MLVLFHVAEILPSEAADLRSHSAEVTRSCWLAMGTILKLCHEELAVFVMKCVDMYFKVSLSNIADAETRAK